MGLEVYEDQTGERLFPAIKVDKDEKIKRFFNNNVDLHIEKKGDKLTGDKLIIHCHIIARKGLDRYQGYYIRYIDNYTSNSFTNFKKESDQILRDLEFQRSPENVANIIYDNIQKFDLEGIHQKDINTIKQALNSNDYLNYRAGNINEISVFCNDILRRVDNIRIVISSEETKLGDINIYRDKNFEELPSPTESTRQILEKYRQKEIDDKKRKEGEVGRNKIKEGSILIEEGIGIIRNAGYITTDIENGIRDLRNKTDDILIGRASTLNEGETDKKITKDGDEDERIEIKTTTILLIIGTIIGATLLASWFYPVPYISERLRPIFIATPEPTPIITPEPEPTKVATPTATIPVMTIPADTSLINNLQILEFFPKSNITQSKVGTEQKFNITINQDANITWSVNSKKEIHKNVKTSTYSISLPVGNYTINVTANNSNGTISREWVWNVSK